MSKCGHKNNQSTHMCINHTKTQKLLPIKILEAAYLLLLLVLVLLILLFRRRTIKMFKAFSWAKNTARGVRFLLRFNMYLFLDQCEEVYHFFWHFPYIIRTFVCSMRAPITVATFQYICDRFVVFDDFSILRHPEILSPEARG